MDRNTILTLNRINRDFYRSRAEEFDTSRRRPWRGWTRLVELMDEPFKNIDAPSVLDVGCGNGRFARFLLDHYRKPFTYIGIDISKKALSLARERLPDPQRFILLQHDMVASPAQEILPREARRSYSLVVAFGLFHHLPGRQIRHALAAELSRHLDSHGILAISFWQFGRFERFRKKIVPWETFRRATGITIDTARLEPGDHIVTWGASPPAFRYCHFIDAEEAQELTSSLPVDELALFCADGETNDLNQYIVMTRRLARPGSS